MVEVVVQVTVAALSVELVMIQGYLREELSDANKVVKLRHGLLRVLATAAVKITVEDATINHQRLTTSCSTYG